MTTEETINLIERCLNSDMDAFETLVHQYERLVFSTAYRMLNNHSDAQDVTQEVFIKVYQKLNMYKPTYSFAAWISTITSNTCIDYIRKNKKKTILSLDQEIEFDDSSVTLTVEAPDLTPEQELLKREKQEMITKSIEMLDHESRQLIILRDINGLSYGEIAENLDLKLGTVKSKISRARIKLQKIILSFEEQNFI